MNKENWCRECRSLAEAQAAKRPDASVLRDALVDLDHLVLSAPWDVRNSFAEIDEEGLARSAQDHADRIEGGTMEWPHRAVGANRALLALAIQIRAVDELLAGYNSRNSRPPALSAREWRSSTGSAFVIPSRRRRDLGSTGGDALGYRRRGILKHRIIPTTVAGMPVRLVPIGSLETKIPVDPLRLGAALFPDYAPELFASGDGFRVADRDEDGVVAAIEAHVEHLGRAHAIVWPELTIDDDGLEAVQSALAARAMADGSSVNVVIAGSWHRVHARSKSTGNVAPILDGTGEKKDEYAKIAKFRHRDLGWEDISQGDELLVLVCDRFIASVAICKDYCDLHDDPPWRNLDVDLILIPSMGNGTTMAGHLNHAHANRINGDQRAFVVQHGIPRKPGDPRGFVLFGDRNPPTNAEAVRMDDEWGIGTL